MFCMDLISRYSSDSQPGGMHTPRGTNQDTALSVHLILPLFLIISLGYLSTVTTYKFEITPTIWSTNISLIWKLQFKETGCQGVGKWKKVLEPLLYYIGSYNQDVVCSLRGTAWMYVYIYIYVLYIKMGLVFFFKV